MWITGYVSKYLLRKNPYKFASHAGQTQHDQSQPTRSLFSTLFFVPFSKIDTTFSFSLGLGDDAPSEIKKPRRLQIFEMGCSDFGAKSIIKVSCGGMHTIALASNGVLYSWGCNDDGALGRKGQENVPVRGDGALDIPVSDISTGDCHSVAYNTHENTVFYWGCYKVS